MNFCPQCGSSVSGNNNFCSTCGNEISAPKIMPKQNLSEDTNSPIQHKTKGETTVKDQSNSAIIYGIHLLILINIVYIGFFLFKPNMFIKTGDDLFDYSITNKFLLNIAVAINLFGIILLIGIRKISFLYIISFISTIGFFIGIYIRPQNYVRYDYKFNDESLTFSIGLIALYIITIISEVYKTKKQM